MTIKLYVYNGIKNKIDKVLTNEIVINNVIITNNYNLTELELKLKNENLIDNYNYCYILDLNRYYFITDIIHNIGGIYLLKLKCDVLKTYSNLIKNARCVINKSENPNNNFVDCNKSNVYTNEVINLQDNFNHNGNLILVTSIGD